jgi:hypothetical protein
MPGDCMAMPMVLPMIKTVIRVAVDMPLRKIVSVG